MSSLSTSKEEKLTIEDIISKVRSYIEDEEQIKVIQKAYDFAKLKHEGQFRKTGEPYITHPMNVALILTSVYADYETISAGLLHDVLEDCDCTPEEMEENFGPVITKLVKGVTKLSKINFSTENEYLIDYYKKIIVGMSEDVRVIIIKLADRLHNMRTLWAIPEDRQKVKAHEALEILAPIAHHLGIHKIKSELEDLSLRYLKPDVFYDIAEKLNKTKLERDKAVFDMEIASLYEKPSAKRSSPPYLSYARLPIGIISPSGRVFTIRKTFALYPPASPLSPAITIRHTLPLSLLFIYGLFIHSGESASASTVFETASAYCLPLFIASVARRIFEEATSPIALVRCNVESTLFIRVRSDLISAPIISPLHL